MGFWNKVLTEKQLTDTTVVLDVTETLALQRRVLHMFRLNPATHHLFHGTTENAVHRPDPTKKELFW